MPSGHSNQSFINEIDVSVPGTFTLATGHIFIIEPNLSVKTELSNVEKLPDIKTNKSQNRDKWGKDIEFLLSCIALSVGLGNVWRFPFTALDNGGGAFLIPYLIVLLLVGRPVYYMEMIIGQFSSRGSVKVFDFAPAMRGIGYAQVFGTAIVTTYYASLMAITIRYIFLSFDTILPWSECNKLWIESCVDSKLKNSSAIGNYSNGTSSSAELFFLKEVLHEIDSIHNGIGIPDYRLVLCLALSWSIVALILIKGVRSSGKASYFLATFPYVIMVILLIRAMTLPGAMNGILYFITPQWKQIFNPKVWYAAVTQVFFSLAICFGNIIMYASYNRFSHNIYRDANIVTTLDTLTSILSGLIIFSILGNLAHETGATDISTVVKGGSGLAFVSYPDAIAKFQYLPQLFSVLFFIMLFVLGIGSNVGMASCVMTVIRDRFPQLKHWVVALFLAFVGLLVGCIYVTPGGQYVLNLLDFFGASFVAFVYGVIELVAIGWIYGVDRLCKDVEFMLGIRTGIYWRISWGIITPALMLCILIYTLIELEPIKYRDYIYPDAAYSFGWCLSAFALLQLPCWAAYAIYKQKNGTLLEKILESFRPINNWGPSDPLLNIKYKQYIKDEQEELNKVTGIYQKIKINLFGR